MDRAIAEAFRFLVDQYGFRRVATDGGYSYQSPTLAIESSFNERDGFETLLSFPVQGAERIAVGTILGALRIPNPHDEKAHAMFIALNLSRLVALPPEVYSDLAALRFWHAEDWRQRWGTGILMDSASIASESARLARIKALFGGSGAQVA